MKEQVKIKARKIRLIVFSVIGYSIIFILLASAVFVLVSHSNGNTPFIGGYGLLWVKTGSMQPTIPERSYILIERAGPEEVENGDVIAFVSDDPAIEGQTNVHRVVGKTVNEQGIIEFTTRGDNVRTNIKEDDYPASGEKLIGKYVKTLAFLSIMGRTLSNTVGVFVLIIVIMSILMIIYLPDMSRIVKQAEEIRKNKKKEIDELVRLEVERLKAEAERKKEDVAENAEGSEPEDKKETYEEQNGESGE